MDLVIFTDKFQKVNFVKRQAIRFLLILYSKRRQGQRVKVL